MLLLFLVIFHVLDIISTNVTDGNAGFYVNIDGKDVYVEMQDVRPTLTEKHRYFINAPGFLADIEGEDIYLDIQEGRLRGRRRPSVKAPGSEIFSHVDWYIGISYAEPPVESLRFSDPQPAQKWSGVRDAIRFSKVCPQNQYFRSIDDQDEDCLYLNVYSPVTRSTTDKSDLLAVMVYIHGGSYRAGSGAVYIGDVLALQGVVVVSLNYRLELLGFLTSGTDHMTGNYGLLDQIFALKWVKNNIHKFRGDPNRVTIFGNSAGGGSVGLLSVSPLAKGLFQQTIAQSGSALSFWASHNTSVDLEKSFREVATLSGCNKNSESSKFDLTNNSSNGNFNRSSADDADIYESEVSSLIQCLRGVDWKFFVSDSFESSIPAISPDRIDLKPVVDGKVLPKSPRELCSSSYSQATGDRCDTVNGESSFHIKALMTGLVENEMSGHMGNMFLQHGFYDQNPILDRHYADGLDRETFEKAIDHVMSRSFGYDELISHIVLSQYTNWSNCSDPYVNRHHYIEFLTDIYFLVPTVELAGYASDAGTSTFLYLFNFVEKNSYLKYNHHELEMSYVFGGPFTGRVLEMERFNDFENYTDQNRVTSSTFMKMWSNFAKYGTPMDTKSERVPGVENIPWKTYDRNHPYYMRIETDSVSLERDLKPHHVNLWNRVIPAAISRINQIKTAAADDEKTGEEEKKFCLVAMIASVVFVVLLLILVIIAVVIIVKRNNKKN